jgi:integrase
VNAFKNFCRVAGINFAESGAEILGTAQPVWDWKAAIEQKAAAENEERQHQLFRSANSTLRQARSLFSRDMLEYYERHTTIRLPDISKFLAAPGFKGVGKLEYHAPADAIIAKTFAALEKLGAADASASDRNIFVACWCALGFGLRASEIAKVRRNWFTEIDGAVWLAGSELAKNKKYPRVRAQLGAWQKLAPLVKDLAGEAFVIQGTDTERKEDVFRRVSEWMRGLGWQTQHHVHELRAWAGCQIAEKSERGLLDAQTFLRHAQYSTTEKFYGHHMKRRLGEVKLVLPPLPAAVPDLKVVNGGQP